MKIVSNKPTITRKELEGVLDCLINDDIATGNTVKNLETAVSDITGQKFSVAVNSLTAAFHLAFQALDLDSESEIIMPSFGCSSPVSALGLTGAKPVLIDSEENSIFPSPDQIKSRITANTKAIVIRHTFGYHFPLDQLADIQIPIIEDISAVLGTEHNSEPMGKKSSITVISFAPSMMITTGNGGMVQTSNTRYYSVMRDIRGRNDSSINYDYIMTDLQAAMGISQLYKLKEFIKRRRDIAGIFHDALKITSHRELIPYSRDYAYQSFPVLFDSPAEKVQKYWKKAGIEVIRPVESPIHSILGFRGLDYPNSDRLSKKLYSLPLYPTLSKKEIEGISKSLSSFI